MSNWAEMHRAGTARAIECLGERKDLPDLLLRFDAWLAAIGSCDEPDRATVAIHPATGILADALEAADLQDEATYLRAFIIVAGPVQPGVWVIAHLLGRAAAHRYTASLTGQTRYKPRLFGLETYGAFDAFRAEAADILERDAIAKAAAVAEAARKVVEVRQNPGKFAVFTQEQEGVAEAVRAYQNEPAIKEAWETRLDGHARFGSTLLAILLKADTAEFLSRVGALPHPVFAEQVLPDAAHLSEDELLFFTRGAHAAFDDAGVYQASGMTVVRLLHRVGEKIRFAAWGERGAVPIPPGEQAQLEPARAETERVIARYLDALFTRADAVFLAWAWLERLIYEGERRGYWRTDHRRGDGIVLDPLITLIVALVRRLEPRTDLESWVLANPPLWRIDRAMAGIAVRAFALPPDRSALQSLLEWTLATLAPAFPGADDAVLRSNGVVGRIGAYGLLHLDQPGDELRRLWQTVRPLREQAWRTSAADDDRHDVAHVLILWGLDAVAAAPSETQPSLWSAYDEILRDAAQVDRVTFHGDFWQNVLQRYGWIVARLLADTPDPVTRLARTVRCHVGPNQSFVQFVLTFVRAGGDRSLIRAAVAAIGADLPHTLQLFLASERLHFKRGHFDRLWIDEVTTLYESMSATS